MEKFAPSITVDGETVTPKGYVWVLGFALAGCEWALKEANTPEFLKMVRADLTDEKIKRLESLIEGHKQRILELKSAIDAMDQAKPDRFTQ